ncbi:hypothetical protein [Rhizobium sp. LjRoot258]|uniref:hypothetical protein n=1 Tax=Rhizobium sp. LjRoot258 TaxID=3342299 RepID=UPI003ECDC92E
MSIKTAMCVFSVDRSDQDIKSAIEFCETQGAHMTAMVASKSKAGSREGLPRSNAARPRS